MKHAPDQIQYAYAKLVSRVFLLIRNHCYSEEELHDLGNALHNVFGILGEYDWIEDEKYRSLYLRPYDEKWNGKGLNLEQTLDSYIREFQQKEKQA